MNQSTTEIPLKQAPVNDHLGQAEALSRSHSASAASEAPSSEGYTVTVDAGVARATQRQDLLSAAKELLPHEKRLQACMSLMVDGKNSVDLEYCQTTERARVTNVCRCDNPHLCPNCGPIIAEQKRRLLQEDITIWELAGNTAVFVVLTIQHFNHQSLASTDKRIDKAIKRMFDSRDGRAFKQKWGVFGRQRNPDITYREENGWHSHRNFIFYLGRRTLSPIESQEFEQALKQLWQANCEAVGGYADLEHGCKVRFENVFDVADYIASKAAGCGQGDKPGDKPGVKPTKDWGIAEELTKHNFKQSKKGITPTELLELYAWGNEQTGQLWQEYANVFKGKKFIDTSPGLRARLDELKEQYQDQLEQLLPEDPLPEYEKVAYLGPDAFKQLVKLQMVLWLIEEVKQAQGDPVKVRQFLEESGITQVYYPALDGRPPDWLFPDIPPQELIPAIQEVNQFIKDWNDWKI